MTRDASGRPSRGAVLACALAASCGSGDPYDATVQAAASLSEAFIEIAASYECCRLPDVKHT